MSRPSPLNDPQLRAVNHLQGPLLILAGPGSGKTRVVTHRIARLVKRGVDPGKILAVTFTNKAAREMRERVRKLLGRGVKGLTVKTFHSACVRILRSEIETLGYGRNFIIYDQGNQQSLLRGILRDIGGESTSRSVSDVMARIADRRLAAHAPVAPASEKDAEGEEEEEADPEAAFVAGAGERYQRELKARNAVDFDDLIELTVRLLRERKDVLERWRERYEFILVDEYQDTNLAQDEVLRLLAGQHRNLCVVGDDDQSIYGWRGAELDLILGFGRRWPECNVVRLEQNYRSTRSIVAAASALIKKDSRRHDKELFSRRPEGDLIRIVELVDDDEEADFISSEIGASVHASKDSPWVAGERYAVLFRTNEQMRPLERALRRTGVPYRLLGGRSFFERKEVLDLLSYLRVAANPQDEVALLRVVNTPPRGLGSKTLEAFLLGAREADRGLFAQLQEVAADRGCQPDVRPLAREGVERLVAAIGRLREAASRRSTTLVADLIRDVDYASEVERSYKDGTVAAARLALAHELGDLWQAWLKGAGEPELQDFIDSIALSGKDDDDRRGGVTLATVHASKGLEFPEVYVAGLEEGIFPHRRAVDDAKELAEERRVLFVAMTRAQDCLTLTWAASRTSRGKQTPSVRSRFLDDLPEEGTEGFDPNAPATRESVRDHLARMRELLG